MKTSIKIEPGMRFGKLLVVERDPNSGGAGHHIKWICKCDCGNMKSIESGHLRNGQCSCSSACAKSIPIGTRFGKLVVIRQTEERTPVRIGGHTIYECKCDCGNICKVDSASLKRGNTTSCGCNKSKGNIKIEQLLVQNNIPYIKECVFPNFKSPEGGFYRFDFFINNTYLIEYDGEQHFLTEEKGYYTKDKIQDIQERDLAKNNFCKENNIPLIRIPYTHTDLKIEDLILETSSFILNN